MSRDVRGACAIYYSYQVKDVNGRITVPFRRRTAHSFTKQFAQFMYLKMGHPTSQTVVDTGGTSRSITNITDATASAASTTSTRGLVVGTGTTAVAITDSALVTQIAHGSSASQLQYGASVVNLPSSDSTSTTLILTRPFSNASGGTITIKEIGIYASMTSWNFCVVRDLATIALLNGDVLTLNYILKTTA